MKKKKPTRKKGIYFFRASQILKDRTEDGGDRYKKKKVTPGNSCAPFRKKI